jgi:electron transfer flavoprotein alpha/beta subunit
MNVAFVFDPGVSTEPTETLALARTMATTDTGAPWVVACLADAAADPRALAAGLGATRAALVVDPALADVGPRGRAQALAGLLRSLAVDLVLLDGASDGGGLLVPALASHLDARGLNRASAVEHLAGARDQVLVQLRLAGQRRRLRVRLPAVVSLAPPTRPQPTRRLAGDPELRLCDLAALGLSANTLMAEPVVSVSTPFVPAKPRFITTVAPLLRPGRG